MIDEFENIIQTDEIFFKYAKGMRDVVGKEIHTYNEILFFVSGNVEFISEQGKEILSKNTLVVIPKETYHQFVVFGDNVNYVRCVFNFDTVSQLETLISSKISRIMLIQNDKIKEIFKSLMEIEIMNYSTIEKHTLLKALFAEILVELKTGNVTSLNPTSFLNPKVEAAISFININLRQRLTVSDIASYLNISDSHLAHIFKRDMHISIHKYILEKRLLLAHKKIRSSTSSEQAAIESGFNDYSGFYTQFKKFFGESPSKVVKSK